MVNKKTNPSCLSTFLGWILLSALLGWGGNTLYSMWLRPQLELRNSASWAATPCKVTSARVDVVKMKRAQGEFTPSVTFEYEVNQQRHTSSRLWFGSQSTLDQKVAEDAVRPYLALGNFECYVNPASPSEATLVRKFNPLHGYLVVGAIVATIFGAIMLLFHIANLFSILIRGLRGKTDSEINIVRAMANQACPVESGEPDEPLIIQAAESRVAIAIGLWIFALLWNGITWLVAFFTMAKIAWPGVFLGLFLLAGIAILVFAIYCTLQVFNPQPILACSQRDLYPGSEFELSWMFRGNPSKIRHLEIVLEGVEEVKYRQGTSTRTEKSTFFQQKIVESSEPGKISQGFEIVSIPMETMHTCKSDNNSFTWQIRVLGKIAFWPDIRDRFEIILLAPKPNTE